MSFCIVLVFHCFLEFYCIEIEPKQIQCGHNKCWDFSTLIIIQATFIWNCFGFFVIWCWLQDSLYFNKTWLHKVHVCNAMQAHVLAIIIQGVLLISVIGYNYLRIFKSRADNFLHTLGIVVILLSYSASVLQTDEYAESITKVVLSMWLVYTIIVACVVGGSLLHKRLYKM